MKLPTAFQKKDGNWYCHYNGKQHYLGKNPDDKIRRLVAEDNIKTSKLNLSDVATQYLSWIEPTQSPDSIDGKRRVYRRLVNDLGDIPIHDLTLDRLEAYRNSLLRKVKKITVRTTFIKISALLQFCVERHILPENPCRKMRKLKVEDDAQPDVLTEEEVKILLDLCSTISKSTVVQERDRLIFLLMLHCGLRRIEVSNLRWSDIDLQRHLLVVRNGKGGKDRLVALNDTIHTSLSTYTRLSEEFVVTTRAGGKLSRPMMNRITAKYLDALDHHYRGKKRLSLHALRATFATRLCEKGVSTRVVQGLLGHSDPRVTMRYAAVTEAACLDAVRKLG